MSHRRSTFARVLYPFYLMSLIASIVDGLYLTWGELMGSDARMVARLLVTFLIFTFASALTISVSRLVPGER